VFIALFGVVWMLNHRAAAKLEKQRALLPGTLSSEENSDA
jgi:hypothetical protein